MQGITQVPGTRRQFWATDAPQRSCLRLGAWSWVTPCQGGGGGVPRLQPGPLMGQSRSSPSCTLPTACECRGRLCDELTGRCVCPPRTVPPDCVVCQPQTFGCHPLVGCEECDCSGPGVQELADPTCDVDSGQCK